MASPDPRAWRSSDGPMPPVQYWLVTIAVMSASLIQFLDMTIANVALPHMQAALSASSDSITWVLTSFIVASAVAIPSVGWIAARFGTRVPFLLTLAGFIGSSMLCGIAMNLSEMVAFRCMQGVAAAFIGPLAQTIILDITPTEKHTRALSIWGMTSMLGPIAGPTLGGYLTDNLDWRWVFFINAPIGIPALLIAWRLLPGAAPTRRRLDLFGYAILALALASLQLMLDRGQTEDWFDSGEIVAELVIALCGLWIFVVHSRYTRTPLFPREVVTNRRVLLSVVLSCVMSWVMLGVSALLPMMFQNLFGYTVMQTGELMAPRGIGIFISMMFIPRMMDRLPIRVILATGFSIVAISSYQMIGWTLVMPQWPFVLSGVIQGVGLGMLMVPVNFIAFSAVRPELRTDCSGLLNLVRNMAGSIGISLFVVLHARSVQTIHAELGGTVTQERLPLPPVLDAMGGFRTMAVEMLNAEVNRQAAMLAYLNIFALILAVTIIVIPLCLLVRGKAVAQ